MSRFAWSWRAIWSQPAGAQPSWWVSIVASVKPRSWQVGEGAFPRLRPGQDGVVEGDRGVHDLAQAGAAGVLALGPLVDLDAGLGREGAQRLGERGARHAA
jgi:hypothetical protein